MAHIDYTVTKIDHETNDVTTMAYDEYNDAIRDACDMIDDGIENDRKFVTLLVERHRDESGAVTKLAPLYVASTIRESHFL